MACKAVLFALALVAILRDAPAQGLEKRSYGDPCSQDIQCHTTLGVQGECFMNICSCKPYSYLINGFCSAGSYGDPCSQDIQCHTTLGVQGECFMNICSCKPYSYLINGFCSAGSYGDLCSQDIQCHTTLGVQGECFLNICSCKPNSHFVNDRCYKTAAIGELCRTDFNCYMEDTPAEDQAFCVRGRCTCQLHYSPRNHGTRCLRDARLWERCTEPEQCAGIGLECRETCRCTQGYTAHNESNLCLESVYKLGDPCEYDEQCVVFSGQPSPSATLCLNGSCGCGYLARERGSPVRCWHIRRPGQSCNADEECYDEDDKPGYCRVGYCTCHTCIPDMRDFSDPIKGDSSALLTYPVLLAVVLTAAAIVA